jgi:hypothetical protein
MESSLVFAERWDDIVSELASELALEPVELLANVGETDVEVTIPSGSFAMIFAGASSLDRAAYNSLIQTAQLALSYQNAGGRPPQSAAPPMPTRTDPQVVARLRRQGHTTDHIAKILAAVFPDDGWKEGSDRSRDGLIQRVRRCADDGDRLIDMNDGVS